MSGRGPALGSALGAAEACRRLRAGEPVAIPGACALVWVEGRDAVSFCQGLVTADVAALSPGASCPALLLDAKGHLRVDLRVHRDGPESLTLVVRPALAPLLAEMLERYHFSEALDLLGPEPSDLLTVAGAAEVPEGVADLDLAGLVPGTRDLVVTDAAAARAALGLPLGPPEALEAARVAAGVPLVGTDTAEATLVQEAGLDDLAVSFSKGCYLGQETVARTQHRGRVNRMLRGLRLAGPAGVPAAVRAGGREVGRLTSAAEVSGLGAVGLAILRREVAPGDEVEVQGLAAPARVVVLPFAADG